MARRTPSGQGPGRSSRSRRSAPGGSRADSPRRASRADSSRGDAGRSADRPASRRTAASHAGGAKRTRAPKPGGRITGRAAILALVLSALVLAYAYPVRTYLAQRAEIERLADSQDTQQERIAALEKELAKWEDPEYVRAQARSRLHYIRPDEVPYVVIDTRDNKPGNADLAGKAPGSGAAWYDRMWGSLAASDRLGQPGG
ncbi:MAG: FtsB family cell division protein [Micromonosporaceae bacterium]